MAKVMLVEDDDNLREIYEARLTAEGYDIVTAKNGEDALVVAKEHRPDLIISDVMMPNISGFDMLDILRNTQGLHDAKVIMLTALGQADDKQRAEKLGADRYLVKSQVTLEDIVSTAEELLGNKPAAPAAEEAAPVTTTPSEQPAPAVAPAPEPQPEPVTEPQPIAPVSAPEPAPVDVTPAPAVAPEPNTIPEPAPATPTTIPVAEPPVVPAEPTQPVISMPETNLTAPPASDTTAVAAQPAQDSQSTSAISQDAAIDITKSASSNSQEAILQQQVDSFVNSAPISTPAYETEAAGAAVPTASDPSTGAGPTIISPAPDPATGSVAPTPSAAATDPAAIVAPTPAVNEPATAAEPQPLAPPPVAFDPDDPSSVSL